MNRICSSFSCASRSSELDIFDFCSIMREAYLESFTVKNFQCPFRRAGIWPWNPQQLLSVARPADSSCSSILSVAELEMKFLRTQEEYRTRVLGDDAFIAANGFIDTTSGCVVTAANVMELVRAKKERNHKSWEAQKRKDLRRAAVDEKNRVDALKFATAVRKERLKRMAALAGRPVNAFGEDVTSFSQRRAVARVRTMAKQTANNCRDD